MNADNFPRNPQRREDAKLLGFLFSHRHQLVSPGELALAASVPVDELSVRVAPYIAAGYPIELHPQGGIVMRDPPDIWCAEEILGRCVSPSGAPHTNQVIWDPLLLAETSSTNDVARAQGRKGTQAGFLVAASTQTAGRGRLGRTWESPPDHGLYVSILLRPDLALPEAGKLIVWSSLATADAVEAISGFRPRIKWPNDLQFGGRKLAGLLIETEKKAGHLDFAVVGIGLNVRHDLAHFSPEIREAATSIYLATGQLCRRADLLVALLDSLARRMARPFTEAREAWTSASLTLGQRVTLSTWRGQKQGQAVGLDETGALLLRSPSGEIEAISAGDLQAA